ncbi:hypothetical protein HDA30_000293 [Micrococcus cohnii]|uniref:Uncharacterized protein n=1 Tax=Micrococcus cohnii TaxID=993416 RepID=A0A7W7GME3_9MICC|nr:hypothetical protein [Micrococcus cohnii]MBB4734785.1 hypothetical protein [Micrococcus cohnii]
MRYVRAKIVDTEGGQVAVSNPVGMAAKAVEGTDATLSVESSAADEMAFSVSVRTGRDDVFVEWEQSSDAHPWTALKDDEDGDEETA